MHTHDKYVQNVSMTISRNSHTYIRKINVHKCKHTTMFYSQVGTEAIANKDWRKLG